MVNKIEATISRATLRDSYRQPFAVHIAIDVAILDKSLPYAAASLYELNTEASTPKEQQIFIYLGKVASIDMHAKVIHLDDLQVITYQHLLITSGPQIDWMHPTPTKEFTAGVKLLMNALKLQYKKPASCSLMRKKKIAYTKLKKKSHRLSKAVCFTQKNICDASAATRLPHPAIASTKASFIC